MRSPITVMGEWFRRGQIVEEGNYGGRSPGGPARRDGTNRWDRFTVEQALGISAAIGGVQLMINAVGASDLIIKKRDRKTGKYEPIAWDDYPRWASEDDRPNDYQSRPELFRHYAACKLAGGNGYLYLKDKDRNYRGEYPQTIISVPPVDVNISTESGDADTTGFQKRTNGWGETVTDDYGPIWIGGVDINDGVKAYVGGHKVDIYNSRHKEGRLIHGKLITWDSLIMGYSPFFIGAPPLQLALEAEQHARTHFVSGGTPQTFLFAEEGDQTKVDDIYEKIKDHMADPATRHIPYPLSGAWKHWSSMITPQQSELLDTRRFTVSEVARLLSIPLPLLAAEQITTWGSGVRELIKFFTDISLEPFLDGMAWDLSQLLPRGMRVFLEPNHLKVEDLVAKADYYSKALGGKNRVAWMDSLEVREREGLPEWTQDQLERALQKMIEEETGAMV